MNELPHGYPVHYVLVLRRRDMVGMQFNIGDIVGSWACDLSAIDSIWGKYGAPLAAHGVYLDRYIFAREGVPNPFLEAEAKHKQEVETMLARFTAAEGRGSEPATPDYTDDAAWEQGHE